MRGVVRRVHRSLHSRCAHVLDGRNSDAAYATFRTRERTIDDATHIVRDAEVVVGDVEFIFEPDPTGGGHGECITKDQHFLRIESADDLGSAAALESYLGTLKESELIALEFDELSDADVEPIRMFAATHGRAVFARKSRSIALDVKMFGQLEEHEVALEEHEVAEH